MHLSSKQWWHVVELAKGARTGISVTAAIAWFHERQIAFALYAAWWVGFAIIGVAAIGYAEKAEKKEGRRAP